MLLAGIFLRMGVQGNYTIALTSLCGLKFFCVGIRLYNLPSNRGFPFLWNTIIFVVCSYTGICVFLAYRKMIDIIRSSSAEDSRRWQALMFACLLFVVTMLYGIVATHWLYQCDIVGMHLKTLITTTVYRKASISTNQ